jgi:fatty acyl-CoA reductase
VKGDVTLEDLGLSREDRSLIMKKVSVIFHCAANVRFDQKLKNAIRYNTLGTQRVLELAEDIDSLDVSTGVQVPRVR